MWRLGVNKENRKICAELAQQQEFYLLTGAEGALRCYISSATCRKL